MSYYSPLDISLNSNKVNKINNSNMKHFQVILSNVPTEKCERTYTFQFDSSLSYLDVEKVFFLLEERTKIPFYYFKIHKGIKQYSFIDFFSGRCKEMFCDTENTFFFRVSLNLNGEKQIKTHFEKMMLYSSFHRKNAFHLSKFMSYLEDSSELYSYLENLQISSIMD